MLKDYKIINQDTLKSSNACLKSAENYLSQGLKVAIDNTNPTKEVRNKYLQLAKGKKVACLWFTTCLELVKHNITFRELSPLMAGFFGYKSEQPRDHVPFIAIHSFFKKFESPKLNEGFDQVYEIPFFENFSGKDQEFLWNLFYQ